MKAGAPILKFASCVSPEPSGTQEREFQAFRRQGSDGPRPAGQGFMSTQRRADRMRTTDCMDGSESLELSSSAFLVSAFSAQYGHAHASGGTAPMGFFPTRFHPIDKVDAGAPFRVVASLGTAEQLATNSLQSDYRSTRMVRLVFLNIRRGSPPAGAGGRAAAVTLKSFGSSFPHIPSSTGLARLHLSLPRVPAALSCRTERYDGKRDMYFQHSA